MISKLHILYVGDLMEGGTCRQRKLAMQDLGHYITSVSTFSTMKPSWHIGLYRRVQYYVGFPSDINNVNDKVIQCLRKRSFDLLWIDDVRIISRKTLFEARHIQPDLTRVALIMDDPYSLLGGRGWRRFRSAIPEYDLHFVIRKQNITELKKQGSKRVERYHKGFSPEIHHPGLISSKKNRDVLFAGRWEPKREKHLVSLLKNSVNISILGDSYWKRKAENWNMIKPSFERDVYGDAYTKVICSTKIALCFYSQWNRDLENSRMYEIPACGTFMLAERNEENINIFKEGKEAEFFGSSEELLDKVQYYLKHPEQRERIATAGRERCLKSGYSYHERLKKMLELVSEIDK